MTTPTQWAWDVPLPRDAAPTRIVLLALAEFSTRVIPGTQAVRLGVVDPTHPAISDTAGMDRAQVDRHVAALVRADVLIPAPGSDLVRFNEDITTNSKGVATVISDTLAVLPDTVPTVTAAPARDATEPEQDALVDIPTNPPAAAPAKPKTTTDTPEQAAAKDILSWWWQHWTETVSPVSNGPAFSAHAKRIATRMLAEGYPVTAIKDAFVAVDEPLPPEWAVRNHLRGKRGRGASGSAANRVAAHSPRPTNPFETTLAGVSR